MTKTRSSAVRDEFRPNATDSAASSNHDRHPTLGCNGVLYRVFWLGRAGVYFTTRLVATSVVSYQSQSY